MLSVRYDFANFDAVDGHARTRLTDLSRNGLRGLLGVEHDDGGAFPVRQCDPVGSYETWRSRHPRHDFVLEGFHSSLAVGDGDSRVDGVHGALLSSGSGPASVSPDRRTRPRANNPGGAA